jgi:hypothetical protein
MTTTAFYFSVTANITSSHRDRSDSSCFCFCSKLRQLMVTMGDCDVLLNSIWNALLVPFLPVFVTRTMYAHVLTHTYTYAHSDDLYPQLVRLPLPVHKLLQQLLLTSLVLSSNSFFRRNHFLILRFRYLQSVTKSGQTKVLSILQYFNKFT